MRHRFKKVLLMLYRTNNHRDTRHAIKEQESLTDTVNNVDVQIVGKHRRPRHPWSLPNDGPTGNEKKTILQLSKIEREITSSVRVSERQSVPPKKGSVN